VGLNIRSVSGSTGKKRTAQAYRKRSELENRLREYEKMQELERAKLEVELYENKIELIQSIHKESSDLVDWVKLQNSQPPFPPGMPGPKEAAARAALDRYKPSFLDKLLRRGERKRAELARKVAEAKAEDELDYQSWQETTELAKRIAGGDTKAYLQVIEAMDLFGDLASFGSRFECIVGDDPKTIAVQFEVLSEKAIPKEVKSLTKTGKLSVKEMPKTRYFGLLQDYVCSCAIRIARELFAILPVIQVFVHAEDERMNTSTGFMERVTILSVKIDRETLSRLNLDAIDCSDAMKNFEHRMKFLKTAGFQPVEKLEPVGIRS